MTVVIGIDPHKASHTATAIGPGCVEAATIRLRAARSTPEELLIWAARWPERRWGVEGARGLGQLLAQQLVAAGEHVVDVPATLSARVRVGAGNCVVAGQAAFRYSLMSPSQRAVLTTWRCLSGWSGGSVATGGCWSSERWGRWVSFYVKGGDGFVCWRCVQMRSEMRRLRARVASRLVLPRCRQRW